ncbi:LysR family transcriptional regulator [Alkalilimnicola sp. S0819]|uniref:LysR family transcriptional regulator n=1 Tax=Alkalilimnicola sp. S0819 TaxID=2613922 RepID=UPI0012629E63|nr:LysR family transcriptional regulator [Alkalilimnicola sp. S0819]KAB7622752.1 LysR family transcriptional regulator [Alkalilimnicola sp. S0819]MPQ17245.1 LysR family transcriptional regulator [Alkalilimnicola sp. S0819]
MSTQDHLNLDGRALKLLLTVLEEQSVSRAAERLGVSQSAVSHTLDKLRGLLGDPLFVKAGRGIRPTPHAQALGARIRPLLDGLQALTVAPAFDPSSTRAHFTIAANDMQRDLLLPQLFRRMRREAPGAELSIIPSGIPNADMLRGGDCDLMITPFPPDDGDIRQKRLLDEHHICYYDAEMREAPRSTQEYLAAHHLSLLFPDGERSNVDRILESRGLHRRIALTVSNFSGVAPFLKGTDLIATLPSLLRFSTLQHLQWAPVPVELPRIHLYMIWHERSHIDPAQRWLRQRLEDIAQQLLATLPPDY